MTTKEVADKLGTISARKVAELCRTGKMYGVKSPGTFGTWDISPMSLKMYLSYNIKQYPHLKGRIIMPSINDETYSVSELATIFDANTSVIKKWIRSGRFPHTRYKWYIQITKRTRISVISLVSFLRDNPDDVEKLQDRQMDLLARGDEMESLVRHVLMLYSYYKSNGYLI